MGNITGQEREADYVLNCFQGRPESRFRTQITVIAAMLEGQNSKRKVPIMAQSKSKLLAFTALTMLLITSAAQSAPGYKTSILEVKHRQQPLPIHIWYPANDGGVKSMLGKNAVFKGVEVQRGAPPKMGAHPLILLSHGSGGNAANLGWIAAKLADEGAIVVSTNHPGTTSRDSFPRETIKIWQRTKDFTAILDFMQNDKTLGLTVDGSKIGAVGFSLGGYTVLGLAGARVIKQKFIDYCNQFSGLLDCAWIQKGVDLNDIDADKFEQSNIDPRIAAVVAVDPALAQAYQLESLRKIAKPVLLINLGEANTVPAGINGRNIIKHLPNATYRTVKGATHFSFLGECSPRGMEIIKSEGDEPICSEVSNRSRGELHKEIGSLIVEYMKKQLF